MANTVTTLSYANTFGEWLVATDSLISENNILATDNYTKTSGTLYLNETTQNSLQANGSVVVQKELLVQGTGSSGTVQNNLSVGGQLLLTNTTLSLVATSQANVGGLLYALGTGVGLNVANSAVVGGNTTIRYTTITGNLQANSSVNTTTLSAASNVYATTLIANTGATIPTLTVGTKLEGNTASGFFYELHSATGGLTTGGNLVVAGQATGTTVAIGTSNTSFATTQFVQTALSSSNTYAINISGMAQVANTVANTNITGTMAANQLSNTITYGITAYNIAQYTINQSVGTANTVRFGSVGVGTAGSGVSGEIRASNNITAYYSSDAKLKENIRDIPDALSKVDCIGGKLFDWTDEYVQQHGGEDGYFIRKSDFGVVAQDVQQVFPVAVREKQDGTLAVDYEKLCALAFAAIRELKAEIDELKGK